MPITKTLSRINTIDTGITTVTGGKYSITASQIGDFLVAGLNSATQVYKYNGTSFTLVQTIDFASTCVCLNTTGDILVLSNENASIIATYIYDGSSFVRKNNLDINYKASKIVFSANGTVLMADKRVYSYFTSSWELVGSEITFPRSLDDIAINKVGNVIALASAGTSSLRPLVEVYTYEPTLKTWIKTGPSIEDSNSWALNQTSISLSLDETGYIFAIGLPLQRTINLYRWISPNWQYVKQIKSLKPFVNLTLGPYSLNDYVPLGRKIILNNNAGKLIYSVDGELGSFQISTDFGMSEATSITSTYSQIMNSAMPSVGFVNFWSNPSMDVLHAIFAASNSTVKIITNSVVDATLVTSTPTTTTLTTNTTLFNTSPINTTTSTTNFNNLFFTNPIILPPTYPSSTTTSTNTELILTTGILTGNLLLGNPFLQIGSTTLPTTFSSSQIDPSKFYNVATTTNGAVNDPFSTFNVTKDIPITPNTEGIYPNTYGFKYDNRALKQRIITRRTKIGQALIELEPTAIIELYELYFDINVEPFRFHAGTNNLKNDIVWNGKKYYSTAIEVEGFESNIVGRLPRPKVTVANQDFIISNILRDYSDFRNGKFTRIKVFLKHLDSENFDDYINPYGVPDPASYISREIYIISQKMLENKQVVQFELITPFDLESLETATRAIYGRYCYWQYRGSGCGYQGDLICKENEKDFSVVPQDHIKDQLGSFKFKNYVNTCLKYLWIEDKNYKVGEIACIANVDFNGKKDPPFTWFLCIKNHTSSKLITPNKSLEFWEKDSCSKSITACKKRFAKQNYTAINGYIAFNDFDAFNGIMPFGGFPGTDKFSYEA